MTTSNAATGVSSERRAIIKQIVCDVLELEPEELGDNDSFKEDHGADSMGAIEMLSSLERTLGVTIAQNELSRMVDLESVIVVVDEATAR